MLLAAAITIAVQPPHLYGNAGKKKAAEVKKVAPKAKAPNAKEIKKEKEKLKGKEIIKFSQLEGDIKKFSIKRDIFSPNPMNPVRPQPKVKLPPPPTPEEVKKKKAEEAKKQDIEDEIRRSLFFEGYVMKNTKNYALVSVNGEFFAVGAGDTILEKIKIIQIERKTIKVEVESRVIEIQLKGDNENEEEKDNA